MFSFVYCGQINHVRFAGAGLLSMLPVRSEHLLLLVKECRGLAALRSKALATQVTRRELTVEFHGSLHVSVGQPVHVDRALSTYPANCLFHDLDVGMGEDCCASRLLDLQRGAGNLHEHVIERLDLQILPPLGAHFQADAHQLGSLERLRLQKQQKVAVHLHLHVPAVQVVGVLPEGVLDLHRDQVQAPEDEDLDHHEDPCPQWLRDPLRRHQRHNHPVHEQQQVARLGVGKWKGDVGDLHRVVERDHAVRYLLERTGEDGRRDAEHAIGHVLNNEELDPGED
mmetsp:Transcript_1411/g.4568  ORF Transcript_1411/g.4568 Transcript_1411/m.4568 type:complete len:283 (-) Transcript_1411:380-1228(-)